MSKKIFSLFVCFAIMFSGIPITAKSYENHQLSPATVCSDATPNFNNTSANNSSEAAKDTAPQVIDTDTTIGLMPGDKTLSELQQMSVDINAIPCFINSTFALQKKHVNRVMEQEANLNTVIYQNQDGTKTTYLFATPVKYIDETGAVKDKSTEITLLTDKTYALGMTNNLVKAYFSSSSSEGTKIEYQDYTISMIPHSETTSFATLIEKDLVKYDNVFGRNTTILYRTKLNGIKEDIVLFKNIEKNQFQFDLKLDNLTPVQMNQSWYLKNSKDELVASFGSILIEDSAGNTCMGSMAIVAKSSRNQYSVTITAPEEFLSAETTVYPVYIDPTIRIYEEGLYFYEDENGYEQDGHYTAIQDTGLYSTETAASDALANQTIHKLGYHTDSLNSSASGKIIYKLYDFFGPYGLYKDLLAEQIGSAFMYIDIAAGNATTLTAMPMSGTWDTDIYGASPLSICDDTLWNATDVTGAQSKSISAARGEYALSITNILKGWARYNAGERDNAYNPAYGFVLENNSTTSYRQINATEEFYADSVYVVMDISYTGGVFYVNNSLTGRFLKNDNYSLSTSLYEATDSIKWIFKYLGNGEYHILSFSNPQLILSCFDSDLAFVDIEEAEYDCCFWTITDVGARMITNVYNSCVLSFDGTSLSLVPEPSASDANYQQTLWTLARPNEYINLTDFELSDNWLLPNTQKTFYVRATATWATNAYFTWSIRADAGVSSQSVFTVSDLGEVWANSRGGTATLTVTHKPTGLVKTFTIKSGAIREGTYTIMNKGTSRYMNVEGISTASGAFIQQWDYHTGNHERWELTILMSGSYIIKSVHSNLWLKAGNSTDNNAIIQYSTYGTTTAKWHITQTSAGNYKLSPINAETYAISVPLDVNNNGTRLIRSIYTNDTNYRDEWVFDNVGETQGIVSGSVYNIQAVHSNKVLGTDGAATENGTRITQQTYDSPTPSQSWRLIYAGGGDYLIQDTNSGKYLTIADASTITSSTYLWTDNDSFDRQLFKIQKNVDGTYTFLSKCSNYISALEVEGSSVESGESIRQYYYSGASNQTFCLTVSTASCPSVVVPCCIAVCSDNPDIHAFDIYLSNYLAKYDYLLNNATWVACENGVMVFNPTTMTVQGRNVGYGWLEAYDENEQLIFICYICVDNILKDFDPSVQSYLYNDGFFLGTISCSMYLENTSHEAYHRIDPLLLRTEWFLHAVKLLKQGQSDENIRNELRERFDLNITSDDAFELFISEVEIGARGGYARERLKMSLNGMRCLLNFYGMQSAAYSIANLDTTKIYTPATIQDVISEQKAANKLCEDERNLTNEIIDTLVKNKNSTTVVIGTRHKGVNYFDVGNALNAKYFYGTEYDAYFAQNSTATYSANWRFIKDALQNGNTIYCSHDPNKYFLLSDNTLQNSTSFAKELKLIWEQCATLSYGCPKTINGQTVWELIYTLR